MEAKYWLTRWQSGDIGFDQAQPNANLVAHFARLGVAKQHTVFVPLCGKSIDMIWLLDQGYKVVGVELSEQAINALFSMLGVEPTVRESHSHTCYSYGNLTVFVGDIFMLEQHQIGEIHCVYDRAALVALPYAMRLEYAQKLVNLCPKAEQFVVTVEYPQPEPDSTPQSISHEHMHELYGDYYHLQLLSNKLVTEGIKNCHPAYNAAWQLLRQ
ncbi:thiopurine S-methyltransferase [Pseudoalteromonas sp. SSDWG2]|uniref:thiopurine S-methyltransferase n=1 Tax=Pseudoalteromonas sp. SSDWG2 TaxID=3139391 RepID=UPI003BADAD81